MIKVKNTKVKIVWFTKKKGTNCGIKRKKINKRNNVNKFKDKVINKLVI